MTTNPSVPDEQVRLLADGNKMPTLSFGVWQVADGAECVDTVRWALELGYRHIDTAQAYGNEESVGRALRESGLPREDVFITTKFYPGGKDPAAEAEHSLRRLGLDHVDLYLVHWPQGGPVRAWAGMERAKELGYTRSIGVSNFDVSDLRALSASAAVPPAVNQLQLSPFEYRRALLAECGRDDVAVEAYSPLGTGRHLSDAAVRLVAQRVGRSPAQVLLRWGIQHELTVIAKSTHRERIEENAQIYDFRLSDEDLNELDALDRTGGTERARERPWW
jgi:diketogulonate reductase-like aldo/keto reductase